MISLLLIEDEDTLRITLEDMLTEEGFQVTTATDSQTAFQLLQEQFFQVLVTDMRLPGTYSGKDLVAQARQRYPNCVIIVITAFGSVESAVQTMKEGADDYLTKPFTDEKLLLTINKNIRLKKLEAENIELKKRLNIEYHIDRFIGVSQPMLQIKQSLNIIGPTDETVLIQGETGTGKEILANLVHEFSSRSDGPFVSISCAALPPELLESELFGFEKGSFTGAYQKKEGFIEAAQGGTLFLDEVDDIPLNVQVKLLRLLQEKEFQKIGSTQKKFADIRVVASTKKDIMTLVEEGRFREDLYYRLNVIPLYIPPLRQRKEDIAPLIKHFLAHTCETCSIDITADALSALIEYNWPGNVRQLENYIRRMVVLGQCKTIIRNMLPPEIFNNTPDVNRINWDNFSLNDALSDFEEQILRQALDRCNGNRSAAAKLLGIKYSTLRDHLTRFGL